MRLSASRMMSSLSCGWVSVATCCQPQPPQPSRACTHGGTTRAGDGFEDLDDAAAQEVGLVGGDLDADPLAGEGAVDQRDPAVVDPAERITAGNHARRRQFHPDSQARSSARLAHRAGGPTEQ